MNIAGLGRTRFLKMAMVALVATVTASLLVVVVMARHAEAATLPPGFEDQVVASPHEPVALASLPDGRMLVAQQAGQLVVFKNGQLLSTPALDISGRICSNIERGLVGVAVDPNFSTNRYVYLFYTHNKHGACPTGVPTDPANPVNRVSRFVMSGDTVDLSSEKVLIDNVPSPGQHNAGDMHFGKDGYLYVSVGDGGCDYAGNSPGTGCGGQNDASRDTHVLLGKILRVTRDGGIPSTNPYLGADSARCNVAGRTDPGKNCQETFAQGLRNPFRFAMDPDASGTRFLIGDVGGAAWEEIDEGKAGADYGWNLCEGAHDNPARSGEVNCTSAPYTPPVHEYSHTDSGGCASITGQAFVPTGASWPASYEDSYLFGDYVCNKIFALTPKEGGGFAQTEFATGLGQGGPIDLAFASNGTGQALYYTTFANRGEVHRITFSGAANQSPTASLQTTSPNYGPVPLTVNFDGSASKDPDGDALSYVWDFGDASAKVTTTTPTTSYTYTQAGTYTAKLSVRDPSGAVSVPATAKVFPGNTPPEPTVDSPASTKLFRVGEQITLRGSATDPQDGQLPDSALSWEVRQWHNGNHYHPFSSGTGNDLQITAPAPEDLAATGPGNHLQIRLTATDSNGLTKTITQELQPNRVNVTFASQPSGLSLLINGTTFATPRTLVSWEGYTIGASAPSPQTLAGTSYAFSSWSDGGSQTHSVLTGASPSTHTATYQAASGACTISGTSANDTISGTSGADVICGKGGNDTIKGAGGNDVLKGEGGADQLYGGQGDDTLDGGTDANNSNDTANYSASLTAVTASLSTNTATGEGTDTLLSIESLAGSPNNDTLTGSGGNNVVNGGNGADTLGGLGGTDRLTGGGGNDTERGGSGNDSVVGGSGSDGLFGGGGDDTVDSRDGTSGNDTLDGGTHVNGDTAIQDPTERSIVGFP